MVFTFGPMYINFGSIWRILDTDDTFGVFLLEFEFILKATLYP